MTNSVSLRDYSYVHCSIRKLLYTIETIYRIMYLTVVIIFIPYTNTLLNAAKHPIPYRLCGTFNVIVENKHYLTPVPAIKRC